MGEIVGAQGDSSDEFEGAGGGFGGAGLGGDSDDDEFEDDTNAAYTYGLAQSMCSSLPAVLTFALPLDVSMASETRRWRRSVVVGEGVHASVKVHIGKCGALPLSEGQRVRAQLSVTCHSDSQCAARGERRRTWSPRLAKSGLRRRRKGPRPRLWRQGRWS